MWSSLKILIKTHKINPKEIRGNVYTEQSITVISAWYNEELMAPFFLAHYEDWVDNIIILLDSDTNDNTKDILLRHPKVSIQPLTFPNKFDDLIKINALNQLYSSIQAGYVICVDCDELVCPVDFRLYPRANAFKVKLLHPWRNVLDTDLDPTKKPIIDQRRYGTVGNFFDPADRWTKPCIAQAGLSIQWGVGQHSLTGNFRMHPTPLIGLHWQCADESIILARHARNRLGRNSPQNIQNGFSHHYNDPKTYLEERILEECKAHLHDKRLF